METPALACLLIAFFVELKAIEYKPEPVLYTVCTIAAWVFFLVGMVIWLIPK